MAAPFYATKESAGCDVFILKTLILAPGEKGRISFDNGCGQELTGKDLNMKSGYAMKVVPRSSSWRHDLSIHEGLIDADYEGPLLGLVRNDGDAEIKLTKGSSICQLVVFKFERLEGFEIKDVVRIGSEGSTGNTLL